MKWYIKRKPTGYSFFRDGFPYFSGPGPAEGSFWVEDRKEAKAFTELKAAREWLKFLRGIDEDIRIVRITARKSQ